MKKNSKICYWIILLSIFCASLFSTLTNKDIFLAILVCWSLIEMKIDDLIDCQKKANNLDD